MAGRFEGKAVLITGASSGIGAACAVEFAREGARLALFARRQERLEEVRRRVEDAGGEAILYCGDVTRREDLEAAVQQAVEVFGSLDVVLANAGFGVSGAAYRLDTEDYRRQFEVNVFGVLDTAYASLPQLERSKGRLGIVSSIMGRICMPASAPYCASKYAAAAISECLYYDLADRGVSVTLINPGIVASEIRTLDNTGKPSGKEDPAPKWLVMPVETSARQIVRALHRRKPEVIITRHGKAMVFLARHFPRTNRLIYRLATRNRMEEVERRKRGTTTEG